MWWPQWLVTFALLYSAHTHNLCLLICYVCCFACLFIMWPESLVAFALLYSAHTHKLCLFTCYGCCFACLFIMWQSRWLPFVMFVVFLVCLSCGQSRWLPLPFYIRHTHTSCVCSHRVLAIARGPSHFLVKDIFAPNSKIVSSLLLTDDSFPHSRCQQHYPLL